MRSSMVEMVKRAPTFAVACRVAALLLLVCTAAGVLRDAWTMVGADLCDQPDEAAHFTSGVMAHDYLLHGLGTNPLGFAEQFYVRYPKVAIGHWPPFFYALQACWYLVFGTSIAAARALVTLIGAALAWALFRRTSRTYGFTAPLAATAIFLCLPAIRSQWFLVMSDLLVALLIVQAVFAFSDALRSGGARDAARFVLWSTAAILTKGNAWGLGVFAILAPLATGHADCFRRRWYWLSGIAIVTLAAPFYIVVQLRGIGYGPRGLVFAAARAVRHLPSLVAMAREAFPISWVLLAGLGLFGVLAGRGKRFAEPRRIELLCAAVWLLTQIGMLAVWPLSQEARVLTPSVALLFVPAVAGFSKARELLSRNPHLSAAVPILIALGAILSIPHRLYWREGYAAAAAAIPYRPAGTLILVSSYDVVTEGAFIAARLLGDPDRAGIVLRGTKVLAKWSGSRYESRYQESSGVLQLLRQTPVQYVVMDRCGPPASRRISHALLEEAVWRPESGYRLRSTIPIRTNGQDRGCSLFVYENPAASDRIPDVVRLPADEHFGGRSPKAVLRP